MGSLQVFDRQIRLDWWNQEKIKKTSVFLFANEPLAYLVALSLVAVGYGRIYVIGSREVKDFKILFSEYTGNFVEGIGKFVDTYLGKYLMDYGIEITPITINLSSESTLNLVKNIIEDDGNEKKVILDFTTAPVVKIYLRKLMRVTNLPAYIASFAGDLMIAFLDERVDERRKTTMLRSSSFPKVYARAVKAQSRTISDEHLYLLACGLALGEMTLHIQDERGELFIPTPEIMYPFEGLSGLSTYAGNFKKVAIIGCGALGTFHAIQLSLLQNMRMLRIKEIIFVDPDDIDIVNFNRQIIYWGDTIGRPKAEVMAERFQRMVYDPVITTYHVGPFSEAKDKLTDVDLIIEGVDNWEARKEIATFAIENKIPLITSGVSVLVGYESYYLPNRTYCPYHSISLSEKKDPETPVGCLQIEPSVIFTNITMSAMAILNSLCLTEPLNGVAYYNLGGGYEIFSRFKLEKFSGSCGD